jgi:MarR family transcriptional regulator for hemolysin
VLQYDFENSAGYWICRSAHLFERAMNEELAPRGITYRQCQVLGWLAFEGDLSQTDLAERMRIEPPTLVGILDRMEREGWISREGCPDDRRRKIVRPQPKAEPVWDQIVSCAQRVRSRATRGLSKEQVEILKQLLGVVRSNLQPSDANGEELASPASRSRTPQTVE